MARQPQRSPTIRPDYKVIRDLRGGINTSQPPDQIADNEAALASNLTYMNRVLCVDFGVAAAGSPLFGSPQQPMLWTDAAGANHSLVATTKTLYVWNTSQQDWLPVTNASTNGATTNSLTTGAGTNPSVSFTGSASWTTGKNVAALMDNGLYLVGPAGGTTSPVTIQTPLPVGRSIPSGNALLSVVTFTATGALPVNSCPDPQRNVLFITNGADHVQIYDGTKCIDEPNLVSAGFTAARYIARMNFIMCLGAVTDNGTFYTYRIRRSATGDSTNWTTLNAGFDDLVDTNDDITGLFLLNQNLCITRRSTIMTASYYGIGQQVLWYNYALSETGSIGLQSSGTTGLNSVIFDDTGIFTFNGSAIPVDVGEKVFNAIATYTGDLVPGTNDKIFTFYNPLLNETWILYEAGSQAAPASMWKFNHKIGCWHRRDFMAPLAVSSVGPFSRGAPDATWATWTGDWLSDNLPWNSAAGQAAFNTLLFAGADSGDTSVYEYNYQNATDAGTPIAWSYTSKSFPIPDEVEMLDGLVFYSQGTIALVEVSTDGGVTFVPWATNVGSGAYWSRNEVDGQIASGFYCIRLSGTDPAFKLSWWASKMIPASEK